MTAKVIAVSEVEGLSIMDAKQLGEYSFVASCFQAQLSMAGPHFI